MAKNRSGSEHTSPLGPVLRESRSHLKPLIWLGPGLEVLAAGGAVVDAVPAWAAGSFIVAVPLATLADYQRRRIRVLEDEVRQLYHYDRRYLHYTSRLTFAPSDVEGFWAGSYECGRTFVAIKPIRSWNWNITRRTEGDLPFSEFPPTVDLLTCLRSDDGICELQSPHKQGANFAFRIRFEPMIRPGEQVTLLVKVNIPVYKPATREILRRRPPPKVPPPGEAEYSTTDILYPIDNLEKEIVIPERLRSRSHGLQVLRGDNDFAQESDEIDQNAAFTVGRGVVQGDNAWILRLSRHRPQLKTTYRIYWELP